MLKKNSFDIQIEKGTSELGIVETAPNQQK